MKFIDSIDEIHKNTRGEVYRSEIVEILQYLDDHPELTGKAITESELRRIAEDSAGPGASTVMPYIKATVEALGIPIVDDPKPTNAEKWETFIRESDFRVSGYFGNDATGALSRVLDERGVKAPEGES